MTISGSTGFRQYAENLRHFRTLECEQLQSQEMRAYTFRASLVELPGSSPANLAAAISTHRNRGLSYGFGA